MTRRVLALAVVLLGGILPAAGENIDLVTLPTRNSVQLTIYNSEDLTLVKETRFVTLKRGMNKLQFSWANTLIDPSSVEFRPLEQAGKIEVLDTVFPGQKPQHLIWRIESQHEGQVPVEVSYFTSGLTWSMDYVAVTDPEEQALRFDGYVRVFNTSGEEYEDAEVRLIVGTINLVEKIAELARREGIPVPAAPSAEMRRRVVSEAMDLAAQSKAAPAAGMASERRQIVKEGLSEYFMFTVQGTETILNGWSKRMRAIEADGVKFGIVYRMRAHQYGSRPIRFFIWPNDEEHKLGDSPLPDGQVRLFRRNGRDGLAFLGVQQIRYVPITAKIEVNLGPDDLVVYEPRKMDTTRSNFDFTLSGRNEQVCGWDERTEWVDKVRNYRTKPIMFELHRQWPGHVDFGSEMPFKLFDYQTVETTLSVGSRGTMEFPATVVDHLGSNKKQDKIIVRR